MSTPAIDASRLDEQRTRAIIDDACRTSGIFYATRHGIDDELLADTLRAMQGFFALPIEDKRAIERSAVNPFGFYDRELTKNRRDWKQVFDAGADERDGPLAGTFAQWPDLTGFRETIEAFQRGCEALCFRLLSAMSRALGMPGDHLNAAFAPRHSSFLRLNYYPACDHPAPADSPLGASGNFGIHHHTDAGAITVLLQDDQPGLQVFADGAWTLVEPRRDALLVNIGDIVQVWSNDRYRAALHRVLANRAERYSAPYFFNPSPDAIYAPLPSLVAQEPARYRPIRWGDFRQQRHAGDYADYGEEIQIAHYRIADSEGTTR